MEINNEMIDRLREDICLQMSCFRSAHTLGVEKMVAKLAYIYCPHKEMLLRAAALLHDITKEYSLEEHIAIYRRYGLEPSKEELSAPATLHSVSASLIIPEKYPQFADDEIIGAVRYHTVGRAGMSLCEKLIFLADYIDETRKYEDCTVLRDRFFAAEPMKMSEQTRLIHLNETLLSAFDMTLADIVKNKKIISAGTVLARNAIIFELNEMKGKE